MELPSMINRGYVNYLDATLWLFPVSGIPLTVIRTYDSMTPNCGDFGYSWTLAINDLDIQLYEDRELRQDLGGMTVRDVVKEGQWGRI